MRPVLAALHARYPRVVLEVREVDRPDPTGRTDWLERKADLKVTPTLLVADRRGIARAKFEGVTSFAAIASQLDRLQVD
jgi:DNA-binding transcriptional LysR family regulator